MTNPSGTPLNGVKSISCPADPGEIAEARERERRLLQEGVVFGDENSTRVPWLVGVKPYKLSRLEQEVITQLGAAVFRYFDVVQALYAEGEPTVRAHLDLNVPNALRGLQLDQRMITARLDLVMRDGSPFIIEVEEIYGDVGKIHAMQRAYGTNHDALFDSFAKLGLSHIYVDDFVRNYHPELRLLQRRMAESYQQSVLIDYFSDFPPHQRGTIWRFCYTKDFRQYPPAHQERIVRAPCMFINPLFHGYGTKAILALAFHPSLASELSARLGSHSYSVLLNGLPHSQLIEKEPPKEFVERLLLGHKTSVLKLVDCHESPNFAWGSRGVFFGDRSATRWRKIVTEALDGNIPGQSPPIKARFMVSELIESDRFDMRFWEPETQTIRLMPRARARIAPIFFRDERGVHLVSGHATFVNTSRKVHLGSHAVCSPLDWERDSSPRLAKTPQTFANSRHS